jgi:hypothetical protein
MATLIGSTDITGGSNSFFDGGDIWTFRMVCDASGTVDTMAVYSRSSAGGTTVTLVIYADSSGEPGAVLGQTGAISTSGADGVVSGAMLSNVSVTSGTFYWLAWLRPSGQSAWNSVWFPSSGVTGRRLTGQATVPDPWNTAGDTTRTDGFPIRADGTAGSSAVGRNRSRPLLLT